MRQSWETMTSVSAAHIILTPIQPVRSGRPQRKSRALPTELPRPPLIVATLGTKLSPRPRHARQAPQAEPPSTSLSAPLPTSSPPQATQVPAPGQPQTTPTTTTTTTATAIPTAIATTPTSTRTPATMQLNSEV